MKQITMIAKAYTHCGKEYITIINWHEIFKFITTAKNYEKHSLQPDGKLYVNNSLMNNTIEKKRERLLFGKRRK